MPSSKKYKLSKEQIINLATGYGGCLASDKITVDGDEVGFMYREEPCFDEDSGWRFLAGTEDEEYMDNPDNTAIYDVNTIANYDRAIIAYLHLPVGLELQRIEGTDEFEIIPG